MILYYLLVNYVDGFGFVVVEVSICVWLVFDERWKNVEIKRKCCRFGYIN